MNPLKQALLGTCIIALSACGKGNENRESTASSQLPAQTSEELSEEAMELLGEKGDRQRAVWDHLPDAENWSQQVISRSKSKRAALEQAADLEDFCPGYRRANALQKDTCWLRILSAMARFESNFKPKATYKEHTGSVSVGLLMMNPEHCTDAPTIKALKNPLANIDCAFERMSLLVVRDQALSGPLEARGAAAYWSVLRPPYRFRQLHLGKKKPIQQFTRTYMAWKAL